MKTMTKQLAAMRKLKTIAKLAENHGFDSMVINGKVNIFIQWRDRTGKTGYYVESVSTIDDALIALGY